ncbi:inorganic diphosphatase [Hymenobacter aerilatus]|uniref:inorganic diphosphatase n=1 Tax=Hymenobacter aerilatus TaxID=2932251 RepID=A0A8T9SUQ9_9BACT|nr:inorganic diphosphatase [Hymenobacter aerilatus]UOR05615.1 inorganic diphosphatase [Hymenobacter aerilatus]
MRLPPLSLMLGTLSLLVGCRTDYADLPTFSEEHHLLQAVVEIPAGTNHIQQYDPTTRAFRHVQRAGTNRTIEFLPYPGNLAFIPGTHDVPTKRYPQGEPLTALILAESQPTGTVVEIVPVALLRLDEAGTPRKIVLAIPARPSLRILPGATTWEALQRDYPSVRPMLEQWFRQTGTTAGSVRVAGWKDEQVAQHLVQETMH